MRTPEENCEFEHVVKDRDRGNAELAKWKALAVCAGFAERGLLAVGEALNEKDKRIAEAVRLLKIAQEQYCSMKCPSFWIAVDEQPHTEECKQMKRFIDENKEP